MLLNHIINYLLITLATVMVMMVVIYVTLTCVAGLGKGWIMPQPNLAGQSD